MRGKKTIDHNRSESKMGNVYEIAYNNLAPLFRYEICNIGIIPDRMYSEFEVSIRHFWHKKRLKIMLSKLKLKARIKPIEIYGIDRPESIYIIFDRMFRLDSLPRHFTSPPNSAKSNFEIVAANAIDFVTSSTAEPEIKRERQVKCAGKW